MKLYGYWRSTSSYRVRIALALKGVAAEPVPVHLVRGEQRAPGYLALNPQGRLPTLVLDDGTALTQSPAILEWLDETHPAPPLLPADPVGRARVRAVAGIVADTHPLHNAGALNALRGEHGFDEAAIGGWIGRWVSSGLEAIESLIGEAGYCFGPTPGLADVYLVPQLYAARRFKVPLAPYPKVLRVDALAETHPAFAAAHPSRQADAEG